MKLYIILKSYNLILLNTFKKKFFNANRKNSLKLVKFAFLPKKQKIYTVNRSSHIYNLSKEKFEINIFKQIFVIDLYYLFKKEYPKRFRRINSLFYEWMPYFLLRGQPKVLLFQKLLTKKVPTGISIKFTLK